MDTRSAIIDAFRRNFMEEPLESMSVNDLCASANVSKKTFYNHFSSKQAVLETVLEEEYFAPIRELRKHLFVSQINESPKLLIQVTYETMLRNQEFYKKLVREIGAGNFIEMFSNQSYALNKEIYVPKSGLTKQEQIELDYFCMFLSTTSAHSLVWWLQRNFDLSVAEITELYYHWSFPLLQGDDTPFPEMCFSTGRS